MTDLSREALLARVRESRRWDVVVVGGGATGLGCAVDAAARGHSTLLLEAEDFAKGTSSRATKLIHGGVRYLAQGRLALVREALAERSVLLANAPHLVHPLRFVVPLYSWQDRLRFAAGLKLYDLLGGAQGLGRSRHLDAAATLEALPGVRSAGLLGGVAYRDAQFDDARFAIALMRTLFDVGGVALNYAPVDGLVRDGRRVTGVEARDRESGERFTIAARVVVNATGVWADALRRLDRADAPPLLRPSQGAHVVVDREFLSGTDALLIPRTADGRVLFVIPWQQRVLIGTTDVPRNDAPLEPEPLDGEIDFILATAARHLERAPTRSDVRSAFAGLRPLLAARRASATGRLSREHLVEVSPSGLVTITGGKWTTYRRMAQETIDVAQSVGRLPARGCSTAALRLHGATPGFCPDPHGAERGAVDALPGADRRVVAGLDLTEAEVRHAARHELARGVEDVLARRHRALFLDAALAVAAAPRVATLLAEELGRDDRWRDAELTRFRALARHYCPHSGEPN